MAVSTKAPEDVVWGRRPLPAGWGPAPLAQQLRRALVPSKGLTEVLPLVTVVPEER